MPDAIATTMPQPRAISADILPSKTGPALSATSDMPVTPVAEPDAPKADDKPADQPAPKEGDKPADAPADKPADKPEEKPADAKAKPDPKDDIPAYAKREITIARNQKRDADAAKKQSESGLRRSLGSMLRSALACNYRLAGR